MLFQMLIGEIQNLAADDQRLEHMGIRFRAETPQLDLFGPLIVLGGMVALAAVGWLLASWYARRETRVVNNSRRLFRELCRAHGLNRSDRDLLEDMSDWHGLADPVQLFFEPRRFQPAEMHETLNCQAEVAQLQSQLFGKPTNDPASDRGAGAPAN
jgi:hypothetical protein